MCLNNYGCRIFRNVSPETLSYNNPMVPTHAGGRGACWSEGRGGSLVGNEGHKLI